MRDALKPFLALYVGGMGAKGKNFYNALACRYGWEDAAEQIQDLYLGGKKREAIAAVPDELVDAVSLVGPKERIRDRLAAWRETPVTTLDPRHAAARGAAGARRARPLGSAMAPPVIVLGVGRSARCSLRVMLDRSSELAIPVRFVLRAAARAPARPEPEVRRVPRGPRRLPRLYEWGLSADDVRPHLR